MAAENSPPTHFFKLPRELRDQIYVEVGRVGPPKRAEGPRLFLPYDVIHERSIAALLCVCKLIRSESAKAYFGYLKQALEDAEVEIEKCQKELDRMKEDRDKKDVDTVVEELEISEAKNEEDGEESELQREERVLKEGESLDRLTRTLELAVQIEACNRKIEYREEAKEKIAKKGFPVEDW